MTWRDHAPCAQVPGDIFFPDENHPSSTAAKRICASCPAWVRQECIADTPVDDRWSIRGGLTGMERAHLRRKERMSA